MSVDFSELKDLIELQGEAIHKRFSVLEKETEGLLKSANRPRLATGDSASTTPPASFYDIKTKSRVPVLEHKDSLSSLQKKTDGAPSVGRMLRGIILGGRADDANELADERKALSIGNDSAGGFTVGSELSAQWIDALRAKMVLSQAGAVTIPMQSKELVLAKVTADPTSYWHGENAALTEGVPTFGAISLQAKTIVTLVKLSLELSQDSANIEQILQSTLVNAMATEIDRAGMNGVTLNGGAGPSGLFNLAGRNSVLAVGAPTSWDWAVDAAYELMLDNIPADQIGALIAHPALWKKMRKLKSGITNDLTPLTMPAEIQALPKLWTTAAPLASGTTAKAMIANWRDLIFGVRQDIQVRVLSEAFLGSNLQVAVLCYARVDFAPTRAESFCSIEGITV